MSVTATETVLEDPGGSHQLDNLPKTFRTHEAINLGQVSTRPEVEQTDDIRGDLPPPSTAVEALERWNSPKSNMFALFGTYLSFLILGMNDASPGPLIPYVSDPGIGLYVSNLTHSARAIL